MPSAIVLEKVDLSGATSLAVMDVPAESKEATKALTNADNGMVRRLCIVTKDGAELAAFKYRVEGNTSNAVWDIICFHTSSMMAILP